MKSTYRDGFLLTLFPLLLLVGCYRLPSERALLKLFNENRTEFEALIEVPEGVTYLSDKDEKLYKKLGIKYSVVWEHLDDSHENGIVFL